MGIKLNHVAFYSKTDLKNLYKDAPSNIDEWIEWLNSSYYKFIFFFFFSYFFQFKKNIRSE